MSKQITLPHYNADGFKTTETRNYYVDGFPTELKEKLGRYWKDEFTLAKNNVKFYNHKHTQGDSSVIAQIRSLYQDIKQPSERAVKNAMILILNEDYALKAGGESASDSIFSSSFRIWIADPKTGEDKSVILIKKYSTKFDEVLITMEEIESLFELCLSPKERTGVLNDEALSVARELQRRAMGHKSTFKDGKRIMPLEYVKKIIALYKSRGVTLKMYNDAIDSMAKWITPDLTTEIIEDQPGVNKTAKHQKNAQDRLNALKEVRALLVNEYSFS